MTRASLLHILDHVGGISETEIRELEQLAAAFPYCQTAHVLLAKAAHDRGSMLASQRLRRAATYAADRQLLRQLLEQPATEPAQLTAPTTQHLVGTSEAHHRLAAPATTGGTAAFLQTLEPEDVQPLDSSRTDQPNPDGSSATLVLEEVAAPASESVPPAPEAPALSAEEAAAADTAAVDAPDSAAATSPVETDDSTPDQTPATTALATAPPASAEATTVEADVAEAATETTSVAPAATEPELENDSARVFASEVSADEHAEAEITESAEQPASSAAADSPAEALDNNQVAATDTSELLPAVAPPIRPPAEAGISRFEFGLSEPSALPAPVLYQLPGLGPDEEGEELLASPPEAVPAFRADAALAYALLGGGSRLGYALQLQDGELTAALPTDEFFEPDALLQAHAAAHRPRSRPARTSLDLINRFLQNQPRLKSPAGRALPAEEQTDLSVRSTSVQPQLASESLAKIMVKQGKIDKAIEIYERLMVRQPEKSAYFASQIQQLQTPE